MKKSSWLAIVLICIGSLKASAQNTEVLSRNVFKLSPQHFLQNSLKIGIERFNPTHARSFAFFISGMIENTAHTSYVDEYNGVAGELQLRKYISPMKSQTSRHNKTYHQGVYGALYIQGGYYGGKFQGESLHYDPTTGTYTSIKYSYNENIANGGFGFTIGYQKTLWQVIFLEGFVGGGIQFAGRQITGVAGASSYYYDDRITALSYRGILPKIGLNIGIGL